MTDKPLYVGMPIENDRYELLAKLGNGVQAECWLIRDRNYPELELAAKIWHTQMSARSEREFEERNKRLDQEARLLGGIHHTYTVMPHSRIRSIEQIEDQEHIVLGITMELASEGSLDAFLKRNPTLPIADRVKLLEQLAEALEDLQEAGIIHNDIKPANILIMTSAKRRVAKFGDFGLAFQKGEMPVGGGTVMYMAPELIDVYDRPSLNVTPNEKTDMYSLGVVFYQILLGIHPYADLIENGVGGKVLHGYFETHDTIDFGLAAEQIDSILIEVIQRMCSRDPENRPASMAEVSEDIAGVSLKLRGRASIRFLSEYPGAIDTFRWTDEVHKAFNEHEQLVFLRGNDMERDPIFLASALSARRLHGFAIHRLLGSRDYLLRIWRRDAEKAALSEVLETYEADRSWATEVHDPVLRWPGIRPKTQLPLGKPAELLDMIHALADDPEDDLLVRDAIRAGLIHGRSKSAREKAKSGRRAIRAVCRINFPKSMRLERAKVLGEQVYRKALDAKGVREPELFANPGARGVNAEFVLIVELDRFHRYRELLEDVERTLSDIMSDGASRARLRFRSHFELDEKARYESYDGRLFYELYRRSRSRRRDINDGVPA